MRSFTFTITTLADDINLVTPINGEKLVPITTSLLADFVHDPTLVEVDGVVAYDGVGENGWTATLVTWQQGKRLILDPPAPFVYGDAVHVEVHTAISTLSYVFQAGMEQATDTNDTNSVCVTEATASHIWLGYTRETGNICLRKFNPLTGEVEIVPGRVVDIGYDPTLDKFICCYEHNGRVFYVTTDPADLPTIPSIPAEHGYMTCTQNLASSGPGNVAKDNVPPPFTDYANLKSAHNDTINVANSGSGYAIGTSGNAALFTDTSTPIITSLDPDLVTISIAKLSRHADTDTIIGFIVVKMVAGTPNEIGYVSIDSDDLRVVFTDPQYNEGARYATIPVFQIASATPFRGEMGNFSDAPDVIQAEPLAAAGPGNLARDNVPPPFTNYDNLKFAQPDGCDIPSSGPGYFFSLIITGFDPIGVG